ERCEAMRNFANKIWNASRFVMMNLTIDKIELPEKLETEDKWILSKLNRVVAEVTSNMESYELGIAAQKVYDFIWDSYCDWYIELTKPRLYSENEADKLSAQKVLLFVLVEILKLLHPFMPFITEEIWQALPHSGDMLMLQSYPEFSESLSFTKDEANFETVMTAIKAVRSRRSEMNVPPSKRAHLIVVSDKAEVFESCKAYFLKLAYASEVTVSSTAPDEAQGMVSVVTDEARMFMPLSELVDFEKERARIEKDIEKAQKEYDGQIAKLSNEKFLAKAPEKVVATEKERADRAKALIDNLKESLNKLK
ncbi:MAG: class I tRNA ligase family protein, partial [Oscillospiraceae bacterium]